jgi:nucleoside-diphosphate-sugar epimerase
MIRIGVLGANGQVGAEVCLLLLAQPDVTVVPISRNPTGSAFLRSRGVPCRHGRVTDPAEARRLLGDCDVVLNFARPLGRPADMRKANGALVANMAACTPPRARLVYFSSLCAHKVFRPVTQPAATTAYGWEKRAVERMVRREASRSGKEAWSLRLGHVAGEIQGISAELQRAIQRGPVAVPHAGAHGSNVVYTATIVDAALAIARGSETPGTYDLICAPSWSWRDVLEHEARVCGTPLELVEPVPAIAEAPNAWSPRAWTARLRAAAAATIATPRTRELGLIALNFLSHDANLRMQSRHFQRRARVEIEALSRRAPSAEAFLFATAGSRYLAGLRPTATLLASPAFTLGSERLAPAPAFAPELPPAF